MYIYLLKYNAGWVVSFHKNLFNVKEIWSSCIVFISLITGSQQSLTKESYINKGGSRP